MGEILFIKNLCLLNTLIESIEKVKQKKTASNFKLTNFVLKSVHV